MAIVKFKADDGTEFNSLDEARHGDAIMADRKCRCGCGQKGQYLISGTNYDGERFINEPACLAATAYCENAARELGLPFGKKRLPPSSAQICTPVRKSL